MNNDCNIFKIDHKFLFVYLSGFIIKKLGLLTLQIFIENIQKRNIKML